jgi:peptidoglycan biosynthesis protein MviN/MurJ (putative lipid II flippase)
MAQSSPSRPPRWYGIPLRVLLVTFLGTLLGFAVSLLLAIIGTVGASALRGTHPDMRIAYRLIALPVALAAGGLILLLSTVMEIRHYRQRKALSAIERMR